MQTDDTPRAPVEPLSHEEEAWVRRTPRAADLEGAHILIDRLLATLDAARAERDRDAVAEKGEPTLDELWATVAASLAIAEEHKAAIYRSGDGVPGPEALAGIQKHIEAGLAARVMYARLAAAPTEQPRDDGGLRAELERVAPRPWSRHGAYGQFIRDANGVEVAVVAFQSGDERGPDNEADFDRTGIIAAALADGAPDS